MAETPRRLPGWQRVLVAGAQCYLVGLLCWALCRWRFGDRWWWLFLLNTLSVHLFWPLLPTAGLAALTRRRTLWAGVGVAALLWLALFGAFFLPKPRQVWGAAPSLRVMTTNVYGYNPHPEAVARAIIVANVDIVGIQELSPEMAAVLSEQLQALYPHQVLAPQVGVTGLGVFSRYPLALTGETLPGQWLGAPQLLTVDFAGTAVMLLNVHTFPPALLPGAAQARRAAARTQQTAAIADFAAAHSGPLIVLGDFNDVPQSSAYITLTSVLADAWREAGWGLGHTFPALDGPLPSWWFRIDYIFYSAHWQAVTAELGPWDGYSDHRPVVATLALTR